MVSPLYYVWSSIVQCSARGRPLSVAHRMSSRQIACRSLGHFAKLISSEPISTIGILSPRVTRSIRAVFRFT